VEFNLLQVIKLLAQIIHTALSVSTTSLGQDGLSVVLSQPSSKRRESGIDIVCDALGVGAGVVRVEILVHIEDQVVGCAVRVLDGGESGGRSVADVGSG
jgi:hypothetical protein